VKEADLLLHVIDYSDENHSEQLRVTQETLREIGAETIPVIYVYNKADLCGMGEFATIQGDSKIYMSAKSANGIESLLTLITGKLAGGYSDCELLIPYKRGDIVSYLNDNAVVYETQYREDGVYVKVNMSNVDAGRYSEFILR
jgi:GTP-binding protein HflX